MGWFKQKVYNWLHYGDSNVELDLSCKPEPQSTRGPLRSNGMDLTIYTANGGYIVEFRRYDSKTDRNFNTMHVTHDDEEFSQKIAHIITMEALKL